MNITNYSYINFNKTKNYNTSSKTNLLKQPVDTISFCANPKKEINELKQRDENGQSNIKTSTALRVLAHFGYDTGNGTNHQFIIDDYGNKYPFDKTKKQIDVGFASALIRGVKMADEYDGALFLFKKNLTEQQKEQCRRQIKESPPHLNPNNKYAQELYIKRQEEVSSDEVSINEIDNDKEFEKELNETRTQINLILAKLNTLNEAEIKNTKELIEQLSNDCEEFHISSDDLKLENLKDELLLIVENINKAKEAVLKYEKKIDSGFKLTKEEKEELIKIESSDFGFEKIKQLISERENMILLAAIEKINLISEIQNLFNMVINETTVGLENYIGFQKFIDEAKLIPFSNQEKLKELYEIHLQTFRETGNVSHLLNIIDYTDLELCNLSQLKNFKQELEETLTSTDPSSPSYIDKITALAERFNQIKQEEFGFMLSISDEEKHQRAQKRIDDFNKRMQKTSERKENIANTNNTIETPKTEVSPNNEVEQAEEPKETSKITTKQIQTSNEAYENFINKFASKISPLPIDATLNATKKLLLANITLSEFSTLENDKNAIRDFIIRKNKEMRSQNEANRLKNASRFAFIVANENQNMSLKEISLAIEENKDEDIIQKTNALFEIYNTPMQALLRHKSTLFKKAFDEILNFAPAKDSETRKNMFDEFSKHGQYLTMLADNQTPDEIKTELLKAFWEKYDDKYSTSYTNEAIKSYENYVNNEKETQMQQLKLDEIDQFDWTL